MRKTNKKNDNNNTKNTDNKNTNKNNKKQNDDDKSDKDNMGPARGPQTLLLIHSRLENTMRGCVGADLCLPRLLVTSAPKRISCHRWTAALLRYALCAHVVGWQVWVGAYWC